MAPAGHKYPLLVYQRMMNRWWPAMITLGLGMFALAYAEYIDPMAQFLPWRWQLFAAIGGLCSLMGIFFIILRHLAYVQPFPEYLKLVTPFMRLNISYKRIHRTTTTEMHYLFPRKSLSGWMREILEPLAGKTAIVIDLKGYPVSPVMLRIFLSRFFFKDKTPHLVILVKDWMRFSSELDSMKSGIDLYPAPQRRTKSSILSQLPKK